jgi:hypothetical protein
MYAYKQQRRRKARIASRVVEGLDDSGGERFRKID